MRLMSALLRDRFVIVRLFIRTSTTFAVAQTISLLVDWILHALLRLFFLYRDLIHRYERRDMRDLSIFAVASPDYVVSFLE